MDRRSPLHHSNTIAGRLLSSFFIGTLVPTIMIVALLCLRFERAYSRTAGEQMQISGSMAADLLVSHFDQIDNITMAPYYHSLFSSSKSLSPDDPDYQAKYISFQNEMAKLFDLTTYYNSDISDLIVWTDGIAYHHILYNERWYSSMIRSFTEQPWYSHAMERNGKLAFTPASDHSGTDPDAAFDTSALFITRRIRNLHNPDQNNLVVVRLNTSTLDAEFKSLRLLYDSMVVITNERDELIYSSSPLTASVLQKIVSSDRFRYGSDTWNSTAFHLSDYDLTVHIVYSMNELNGRILSLIASAALIYLAGLTVAYLLFRRRTRWITDSVQPLLEVFSRIEDGDLETHCEPLNVEEFDRLSRSVNEMLDRLNEKIRNEYLMTIQQKSIQLYALQSQIQPHFLNNTLYCFIALNQIGERDTLNSALYSLSHLLRYVLSKERLTTIGEEYDFLEDYLKLQKLRFGNRLTYRLDAPEEYRKIRIPRLLLQPLVENAIIHGIEPSEVPCQCRLVCRRRDDRLLLQVMDDGVGFDRTKLKKMMKETNNLASKPFSKAFQDSTREKTSIGIYYVIERLKLWSDGASLYIRQYEHLTVTEISIPWEDTENESSDR